MTRHPYCFATDFHDKFPNYSPNSKRLGEALDAFTANILRVKSLGNLPIILVGASITTQTYNMLAKFQLGISEDDPALMIYHPGFDPAISQKKEDLRKNLQKEWWVKSQAGKAATGMQLGEAALGMMIPAGAPATVEGIDAILKGMITGVWTAFEVLVEMVWVGAIQERPNLEESMTAADKKDTGFGSTRKFRNLYRGTFKTGGDDIFRVLEDTRIDALALTRNLIVHSGGKVDVAFDSRRVGLRELDCFSQITVGQHIQITGHIVRDLIGPISTMGFDLVRIVDLWILNQK